MGKHNSKPTFYAHSPRRSTLGRLQREDRGFDSSRTMYSSTRQILAKMLMTFGRWRGTVTKTTRVDEWARSKRVESLLFVDERMHIIYYPLSRVIIIYHITTYYM